MNLVSAQSIIQKPEREVDSWALKSKNASNKGISTALPPIPAIEQSARNIGKIMVPANSLPSIGNTLLCSHKPSSEQI